MREQLRGLRRQGPGRLHGGGGGREGCCWHGGPGLAVLRPAGLRRQAAGARPVVVQCACWRHGGRVSMGGPGHARHRANGQRGRGHAATVDFGPLGGLGGGRARALRRRAAIEVVHMDVVLHHGARLRDIGLVAIDHGGPGLWRRGRSAGAPARARSAPVHVPGVPAPGRLAVRGPGQQHAGAKADQPGHHGRGDANGRWRREVAVAFIRRHGRAIDHSRVVPRHVDGIHGRGSDFDELLGRRDHGLDQGNGRRHSGGIGLRAGLACHADP